MGSEGFPLLPIDSLELMKGRCLWEDLQEKNGSWAACVQIRDSITGSCW